MSRCQGAPPVATLSQALRRDGEITWVYQRHGRTCFRVGTPVVEPNVLGTGTFAVGDLMTTKPYILGAAYIGRMSNFCEQCAFDPRETGDR